MIALFSFSSCKEKKEIYGCKSPESPNYNPDATIDDNTCKEPSSVFVGYYHGTVQQNGFVGVPGSVTPISTIYNGATLQIQRIDEVHVRASTPLLHTDSMQILTTNKDSIYLSLDADNMVGSIRTVRKYHFLGRWNGNTLNTSEHIIASDYDYSTDVYLSQSDLTTTGTWTK